MMNYASANDFMELINGWLLILVLAVFLCFAIYIKSMQNQFNLSVFDILFNDIKRPGIRVAKPMLVLNFGMAAALGVGWVWRSIYDGTIMPQWVMNIFVLSIILFTIGGLWTIRILTHPRSGEKYWLLTLVCMTTYLVVRFLLD